VKALSGYAEWFWLMAMNIKDIENRSWSLFRQVRRESLLIRIYLHASKTATSSRDIDFILSKLTQEQTERFWSVCWTALRGKIIGELTITGQVTESESVWFFGPYGFTVRDGQLYEEPIPCKGRLNFFVPDFVGVNG